MLINPIAFNDRVVSDYLKHLLSAHGLADPALREQMATLLSDARSGRHALVKGPYLSLSPSFVPGATIGELIGEDLLHPDLEAIAPIERLYRHQEDALRAILSKRPTLLATGTGSGKTESFLYPIISRCLELRDAGTPPGIVAVLLYPLNALAHDQLDRLRGLLEGTGVSFGMYVGKTPETMPRAKRLKDYPAEERSSRAEMRKDPPRILITNAKQLELLLTRFIDLELFRGATLDYLVVDEAHTLSGPLGSDVAYLLRRLRAFCRSPETVCIASSATLADDDASDAAKEFAARLFAVDPAAVAVVTERNESDPWPAHRTVPSLPAGRMADYLDSVLEAANMPEASPRLPGIFEALFGQPLGADTWREELYDRLSENEIVYQLGQRFHRPRALDEVIPELAERVGRPVSQDELLLWLCLAAVAEKQSHPRLRPVSHSFVSGLDGVVVSFPPDRPNPRLHLSRSEVDGLYPLPLFACVRCGQHYFRHAARDFELEGEQPAGGELEGKGVRWIAADAKRGGKALILVDHLTNSDNVEVSGGVPLHFCRHCGCLQSMESTHCLHCRAPDSLVVLHALHCSEGRLRQCIACGAPGGQHVGAARPLRSATSSDAYAIAQSVIRASEKKRLVIFTDSRQDAAFQAGWMHQRTQKERFWAAMTKVLPDEGMSIPQLCSALESHLDWDIQYGRPNRVKRRREQRARVLAELCSNPRQRGDLEPQGRWSVSYAGLSPDLPFVRSWSRRLGWERQELIAGIEGILDHARYKRIVFDSELPIFSRYWNDDDPDLGSLTVPTGGPSGLCLRRRPHLVRSSYWLSNRPTTISTALGRWGLAEDETEVFLDDLWTLCSQDLGLLTQVTLCDARGAPLPGCEGLWQLAADNLRIMPGAARWRCRRCRVIQCRPLPRLICMGWRCGGLLEPLQDAPRADDGSVVRCREHSAQVPADERTRIERAFKSEAEDLNTIVCTPTLELGIDIGGLDAVLMRNMAPDTASYWQRIGRAGRRCRMAVILSYAGRSAHDRAGFDDPTRILNGPIEPPRVNLDHPAVIARHLRAAVLTVLIDLARGNGGPEQTGCRPLIESLRRAIPPRPTAGRPFDPEAVRGLITTYRSPIDAYLEAVFGQEAAQALDHLVDGMASDLDSAFAAGQARADWALQQGLRPSNPNHDTLGMLAAEGVLPAYGIEAVCRKAVTPSGNELSRPLAIALREFVPGTLLYADGGRFVPSRYQFRGNEEVLRISPETLSVSPSERTLAGVELRAIALGDLTLKRHSGISDEEAYRFHAAVTISGYVLDRDGLSMRYRWGDRSLRLHRGLPIRLVNMGYSELLALGRPGFPLCLRCGAARSPFASETELEAFSRFHHETCDMALRGGLIPFTGLYADLVADTLSLGEFAGREEAYSVGELLRIGATRALPIVGELQILVIGLPGRRTAELLLVDPVAGGTGVLGAICAQWPEIVASARTLARSCPKSCEKACVECLFSFRNAARHPHLNRHAGRAFLERVGDRLEAERPARTSARDEIQDSVPTLAEIVRQAGLPKGETGHRIALGRPFGHAVPELYFPGASGRPGIALFVDDSATTDADQRLYLQSLGYEVLSVPRRELGDPAACSRHVRKLARILARDDALEGLAE